MGIQPGHVPVLLGPALDWLNVRPDGIYVDATAGLGGHSEAIAQRLAGGRLISLDRDPEAVARSRQRLANYRHAEVVQSNYGEMAPVLAERGIAAVDGILLDAGVSSMQIDTAQRGFSFQADGPLDMRMDTGQAEDAAAFLGRVGMAELADTLRRYGDVPGARRIAEAILRKRDSGGLRRTADLADAVHEALPFVNGTPEEVRTVFQAVRMAVNEELRWLADALEQGIGLLRGGGRFVVISFHSGEDRLVKEAFKTASRERRERLADGRDAARHPARMRVLTPKPVVADAAEAAANPRAKSARMRVAERL